MLVDLHAALADPSRLAVAQLLYANDATPGELGERLGLPSNLLAHHLRALEAAGVIARHRSEHDRRRHYVTLRIDRPYVGSLVAVGLEGVKVPRRVLFVCTRNSARSKLAAAIWRAGSDIPSADAGTAPAPGPHPLTARVAGRLRLHLDQVTRHVDQARKRGDLVVTVCDHVHETWPEAASAMHWSVPDPVAIGDEEAFVSAAEILRTRIALLATNLQKGTSHVRI